jgi:2,5-diamino-6-(ribosylamino)-4(3H)-pyrimidinone 5'-phosphate reductase
MQTVLSGQESKAMTHFLRSRHEAILVGVGTAVCDDPGLNCRFGVVGGEEGERESRQPVPVILDPSGRWNPGGGGVGERKVLRLAREGRGRGILWVVGPGAAGRIGDERRKSVELAGGEVVVADRRLKTADGSGVDWSIVLDCLAARGIRSVMVEGGAKVIMDLLKEENQRFVSSVIVTIAPVWLGAGGVMVAPPKRQVEREVGRLEDVKWVPMGEDVVMAGRFKESVQ